MYCHFFTLKLKLKWMKIKNCTSIYILYSLLSGSQSSVSYEEDIEDSSTNADLYVFNDQMAQGTEELILIPEIMRNP